MATVSLEDAQAFPIAADAWSVDRGIFNGSGYPTFLKLSNNLSELTDFGAARTSLGLVIGTDIQAHSTTLDTYAGATAPSEFGLSMLSAVDAPSLLSSIGAASADDVPVGSALSRVNDTNVIVNMTGSYTEALLTPVQITMGWVGQLAVARGGTGFSSYTDGQLLIGNTSTGGLVKASLTSGTGIKVTNAAGAITVSNNLGVTAANVSGATYTVLNDPSLFVVASSAAAQVITLSSGMSNWLPNMVLTIVQMGVGRVSVVAGDGVVINKSDAFTSLVSTGQYSVMKLLNVGTDQWVVMEGFVQSGSSTPAIGIHISADVSQNEGNSGPIDYVYTITRSDPTGDVTVAYTFDAGTTNDDDYSSGSLPIDGTVDIADGETTGTITISVAGDILDEVDEMFTITITVPDSYVSDGATSATGTILNDDVPHITSTNPSGSFNTGDTVGGTVTFDVPVTVIAIGTNAALVTLDPVTGVWSFDTSVGGVYGFSFVGMDSNGNTSAPQAVSLTLSASALTANIKTLFIGDSTMVGVGAGSGGSTDVNGSRPYSMPIQAANRLVAMGYAVSTETMTSDNNVGVDATSWHGYRPEVVVTGTLGTASDSPQLGGIHLNIGTGTNSLAYTTTAEVDRLDLLVHRRSDFGVLGVSVDGGTVQNISLVNATEDLSWQSITGLTKGVHTFTFTRVSGSVRFPVLIDAYDSTINSFHIYNAGARNWTSTDWVNAAHPNSPLAAIDYIVPDVAIIDLGINDWRQSGTTIATFKTNMQTIINRCRSSNPQCKVILSLPHDIQTYVTTTDAWSTAAALAAYTDLATTNSLQLVNGPHEIFLAGLSGTTDPATFAAVNAAGYMHDSLHSLAPPYAARGKAQGDAILSALGLGDSTPLILPDAQWGQPYNETGETTLADGVYDFGMGITVTVSDGTYTATGTPV